MAAVSMYPAPMAAAASRMAATPVPAPELAAPVDQRIGMPSWVAQLVSRELDGEPSIWGHSSM